MARIKLAAVSEVPVGGMVERVVDGRTFLLANVNGSIRVMDGLCSHRAGHLAMGTLTGDVVKCPRHGSEFDTRSGKVIHGPRIPLIGKATDMRTYAPVVEGGDIMIDV